MLAELGTTHSNDCNPIAEAIHICLLRSYPQLSLVAVSALMFDLIMRRLDRQSTLLRAINLPGSLIAAVGSHGESTPQALFLLRALRVLCVSARTGLSIV